MPHIGKAFNEEGTPSDAAFASRHDAFFVEFIWYMEALREKRKSGVPE